jgi:hypothetical protein
MNISFAGVLFRPLKKNNFFKITANLVLAFLPAMLSAYTLGTDGIIFKIMLITGLLILYGYLFTIVQEELENEDDEINENMPDWKFVNNFFTGIKGSIFSALILALFFTGILTLKLIALKIPAANFLSYMIGGIGTIYCIFAFHAAAIGMFAQDFNPIVALKVSVITQIIKECWLEYTVAFIYMLLYMLIIGIIYSFFASILGHNIVLIGAFGIYTLMVYLTLYSKIYKYVRNEFENYI